MTSAESGNVSEEMEGGGKRVTFDSLNDRISALPDELIDRILEKLPMCDVFRTSVLSKRWIHFWTRIGNLDFGLHFVDRYYKSVEHDLVNIVDSVLSRHTGPINKFHIYFGWEKYELTNAIKCKWIRILTKSNVKDLSIFSERFIRLPLDIYDCCSLQRLRMVNCVLEDSDKFRGFKELDSLELRYCIIPLYVQSILFDSPLLEELKIECFKDPRPVIFNSGAACGARLKYLMYQSYCSFLCYEKLPELTHANLISQVEIPMSSSMTSRLNQFSCFLPRIEKLVLNRIALTSFTAGDVPFRLPSPFQSLKHLELQEIDTAPVETANFIFCMLRSSPNLRYLKISAMQRTTSNVEVKAVTIQYLKALESEGEISSISTFHLEVGLGSKHVLSLTRTILNCCPNLEMATIVVRGGPKAWFSEAVKKLPRSSIVMLC